MAFEFVPLRASEQEDLIQFLVKSFEVDPTLNSFRPEVIHWKYFAEHPEWKGTRSFAVKENGHIVAHGGVWPVSLITSNAKVKAIHLIDWAASRSAVGAGVYLLRKVRELADVLLTIGGSQETRKLLPKLGYRRCGELRKYARVIRPWLQFQTTPEKNWKTPLKLLRNSAQGLTGLPSVPEGWRALKVTRFTEPIPGGIGPTKRSTSSRRTESGLNYLLNCPGAHFSGFVVSQGQRLRGYFLLTQVGRQVRIVDIRLDGDDKESWHAISALAVRSAAEDPQTCEVVAASSIEDTGETWLRSGFALRESDPISCYDPRNLVNSESPLNLSLADGDGAILSEPAFPYLS